jgi:hypothetical protein
VSLLHQKVQPDVLRMQLQQKRLMLNALHPVGFMLLSTGDICSLQAGTADKTVIKSDKRLRQGTCLHTT